MDLVSGLSGPEKQIWIVLAIFETWLDSDMGCDNTNTYFRNDCMDFLESSFICFALTCNSFPVVTLEKDTKCVFFIAYSKLIQESILKDCWGRISIK